MVPQGWREVRSERQGDREVTIWQSGAGDAFASLALVRRDVSSAATFETAISDYERVYYTLQVFDPAGDDNSGRLLLPLNPDVFEERFPDGSLRRSYYLLEGGQFPPGQLDVFYMRRGGLLAVVETYSAYSAGNTLVADLNTLLGSLQVSAAQN